MGISAPVVTFIRKYRTDIENNRFEYLYHKIDSDDCGELTSVMIKSGINPLDYMTYIPIKYAHGCFDIEHVTCSENITHIGYAAFSDSSLKSITISDSVQTIDNDAFCWCESLKSINLNKVLNLGRFAFATCEKLSQADLGTKVKVIPQGCFRSCKSLRILNIPDTVESIGEGPFIGCYNLSTIFYSGTMDEWNKIYKDTDWYDGLPSLCTIRCSDGVIDVY